MIAFGMVRRPGLRVEGSCQLFKRDPSTTSVLMGRLAARMEKDGEILR